MLESKYRTKSVAHNVVMNAIVMTSSFIFPLITVPYVSRVLLEYGNGIVAFSQNVVYYFAVIASMGVANYGVVACSRVRNNSKELSLNCVEILVILAMASSLLSLIYLCIVLFVPRFGDARSLYVFMVSGIWTAAFSLEWFYQSIEQYDYITIRALVVRAVGTVCIFAFVNDVDDYLLYAIITVATQGVSCFINLIRMRNYIDLKVVHELRPLRHLRPMASYLAMNVSKGMANKSDILVLGLMGTIEMVGIYQIASKIENMVIAAVESVGSVLLPRLSSYKSSGNDDRYSGLLGYGVDFALIIGLYSLCGMVLCAPQIISILGGEIYMSAVAPLVALAPAVLFASGTNVVSQVLFIYDRERLFALANIISLAVSIGLAVILIPILGIMGSGLAISVTQFVRFAVSVCYAKQYMSGSFGRTDGIKIVTSAIVSFLVGLVVSQLVPTSNDFAQLLATGSAFSLVFFLALACFRERLFAAVVSRFALFRHRS